MPFASLADKVFNELSGGATAAHGGGTAAAGSKALTGLVEMILAWVGASESVFLDAGDRLRDVHGRLARVREGIGRSTELLAGQGAGDMRGHLSAAVEEVGSIGALSRERGEVLASLRTAIRGATDGSAEVRGVFRTLDYVALIARVQVERMRSGQEELVPFAMHVDELVTSGEKVARFVHERMRTLCLQLDAVRDLDEQCGTGDGGATLVDGFVHMVSLIEEQQRSAAGHREEARQSFTSLAQGIAGVVMGIQAHDMARQRFEHTARNLGAMSRIGAEGRFEDGGDILPLPFRRAAMRRIATLEVAQLVDLADVYGAKMHAIDADLARISAELDTCSDLLRKLLPADTRGGLSRLDEEASRLRAGFARGRTARDRMTESVERSVEATRSLIEMTDKLADLEYDLRLAGFNAAVRAAHIEGGDETIGYIARTIREQASNARGEAEKVRGGIDQALGATEELSQRILPGIASSEASIETTLTLSATALSEADAACRSALTESVNASAGLGGDVAKVRKLMGSHEEGGMMMRALSAGLTALLAPGTQEELPAAEAESLDRFLTACYTMEEERAVYAEALGVAPAAPFLSPAAPAAAPGSDEDLDDILF